MPFSYKVSFIGESDHLIAAKTITVEKDDRETAIAEARKTYPRLDEQAARFFAKKVPGGSTVDAKAP